MSKNHKKIKIALISFTQLENRIKQNELGKNKYHIYVYPFIGNTLQGTVYDRSVDGLYFGILTVIGTWTNKYTKGGPPIKHKIVEDWDKWTKIKRGSLSRTIAHELGHVLFLKHHQCEGNCLMGPAKGKGRQGYKLTKRQIEISRKIAKKRLLRKD